MYSSDVPVLRLIELQHFKCMRLDQAKAVLCGHMFTTAHCGHSNEMTMSVGPQSNHREVWCFLDHVRVVNGEPQAARRTMGCTDGIENQVHCCQNKAYARPVVRAGSRSGHHVRRMQIKGLQPGDCVERVIFCSVNQCPYRSRAQTCWQASLRCQLFPTFALALFFARVERLDQLPRKGMHAL